MFPNPRLMGRLVEGRTADLRRVAASRHVRGASERPAAVRSAGWLLVDVGLRLALPRAATDRRRTLIQD